MGPGSTCSGGLIMDIGCRGGMNLVSYLVELYLSYTWKVGVRSC